MIANFIPVLIATALLALNSATVSADQHVFNYEVDDYGSHHVPQMADFEEKSTFMAFDVDRNGRLNHDELLHFYLGADYDEHDEMTKELVFYVLRDLDTNGDGSLCWPEFRAGSHKLDDQDHISELLKQLLVDKPHHHADLAKHRDPEVDSEHEIEHEHEHELEHHEHNEPAHAPEHQHEHAAHENHAHAHQDHHYNDADVYNHQYGSHHNHAHHHHNHHHHAGRHHNHHNHHNRHSHHNHHSRHHNRHHAAPNPYASRHRAYAPRTGHHTYDPYATRHHNYDFAGIPEVDDMDRRMGDMQRDEMLWMQQRGDHLQHFGHNHNAHHSVPYKYRV